jgi:hypothetical protein
VGEDPCDDDRDEVQVGCIEVHLDAGYRQVSPEDLYSRPIMNDNEDKEKQVLTIQDSNTHWMSSSTAFMPDHRDHPRLIASMII